MGRPTKYRDELAEQIAGAIRGGLTNRDACLAAGIDEKTFNNWERRNSRFSQLIAQARAQRAAFAWEKARQYGETDWRFWLEFIDRTCPDYRKRAALELSGPDGGAIEIRGIDLPLPVRLDAGSEEGTDESGAREPLLIPLPAKANGSGAS